MCQYCSSGVSVITFMDSYMRISAKYWHDDEQMAPVCEMMRLVLQGGRP